MGRKGNVMFWTKEIPQMDPNCTKTKSHGDICSKNNCNITDGVSVQELLSDDSKDFMDNFDIGNIGDKVT